MTRVITVLLVLVLVVGGGVYLFGLLLAYEQVHALGEPTGNIVLRAVAVAGVMLAALVGLVAIGRRHAQTHEHAEGGRRYFWSQGEYWETRTSSSGEERLVRKMKQQNRDHPEPRRER